MRHSPFFLSLQSVCILHLQHISFWPRHVQVIDVHMSLVAAVLELAS